MKYIRKPYRVRKKKSILRNRFFWLGILILMVLAGIFYLVCFSSFFQIKKIQAAGNQKVSAEEVEKIVGQEIERKIFIFSTESIFLANFKKTNKIILEEFPQIFRLNFVRKFPDAVIVKIEERKPKAVFSQAQQNFSEENSEEQTEKYFYIDEEGIIFEEIFELSPSLLKIKKSAFTDELKLGERVIAKEQILKILEIGSKLRDNLKIPLEEILVVSDQRLNVKTPEGWQIYFDPEKDLDWQLTKLNAVLKEEIPVEKRTELEYVELRFGNFAPYKFKELTSEEAPE